MMSHDAVILPQILVAHWRTEAYILLHGILFVKYCNVCNLLVQRTSTCYLRYQFLYFSMPGTG